MAPKGSRFDIHFRRKEAEHAEVSFYFFSAIFGSSEAGGYLSLNKPQSIAWTISIVEGLRD